MTALTTKSTKPMRTIITPLNEGQELNYVEYYDGPSDEVFAYARGMRKRLVDALPRGMITIQITNRDDFHDYVVLGEASVVDKNGEIITTF